MWQNKAGGESMKNVTSYTIKNLNKEKIFKQILKKCEIYNVKFINNNIEFSIKNKNKKYVENILKSNNSKVLNIKQLGIFSFLKRTIFRPGIISAILFMSIFVFISNFFVFQYSIIGNELVSEKEVLQILQQNNVSGVVAKNSINIEKIQDDLLLIDKVSLVSVIIQGNTMLINIKEKVYNPEYEDRQEFEYICSEYDGIITEISPIQGTILVKLGQTVKKGQQLVAPYILDTSGQKLSVKPMADIKADVFFTNICEIADTQISMVDTGNIVQSRNITLFNLPIYSQNNICTYKNYRVEESTEYLTYGLLLPIKVQKKFFYEQTEQVIENYFENNKQQILKDCLQKTRQLVENYEIIKTEYQTTTNVCGINRITTTVVVNKSIC